MLRRCCTLGLFALTLGVLPSSSNTISAACPPNSHFSACGTACPATCRQPNPGPCIDVCVQGCFCDPGFLLDTNTGACVRRCTE